MHQSHAYFMLWANQGSWIFQCHITLQSCICQVFWVRQFQVQTFWVRVLCCNFLLLFNVPGALNSLFSSWFTPFYVWALKAARASLTKERNDWQSQLLPQSPLLRSHLSHCFLTLLVTCSLPTSLLPLFFLLFSLFLPLSVFFLIVPLYLVFCPLFSTYSP